ncbi:MAG: methyltransferase domain-containing protein [Deltaproteobacteria bacterium]|nr:methyltransferase domain-containing protein [Deltaproteobacteria bacterium]
MITTEIDKHKIKSSFSKAAKQYDAFASLQKEAAEELLKKLSAITHQPSAIKILDIGCGTGFLTCGLADKFPEAKVIGCDISYKMLETARGKPPQQKFWRGGKGQEPEDRKIYFLAADGSVLPCKGETFDMVASNLAYQWFPDLDAGFLEAYRVLMPGGVFIFSTLGPATLKELRHCYAETSARFNKNGLPPFIDFSKKQVIQSSLENTGFHTVSIETTEHIKTYQDMWGLLKTVKSIGAGNPFKQGDKSLSRGSLLKRMAEEYKERFKIQDSRLATCNSQFATRNRIYATYELIFVGAIKLA